MTRLLRRVGLVFVALVALTLGLGWAVLQSAPFNGLRSSVLERLLSEQTGYNVEVDGTVRVTPGAILKFHVSDVAIPSLEFPDSDLARLDRLALQTNASELLRGKVDFRALDVSGLTVHLKKSDDGRNNWSVDASAADGAQSEADDEHVVVVSGAVDRALRAKKLLNFVLQRSDTLEAVNLLIDDQKSGFSFAFNLEETQIVHSEAGNRFQLKSKGTVNGVGFLVESDATRNGPFRTHATFSDMNINFEGRSSESANSTAYQGRIDITTGEIGDVLDILQLNRAVEGKGRLSAQIDHDGTTTKISEFSSTVVFGSGAQMDVSGGIADLEHLDGADLAFSLNLFPEEQPPGRAYRLADVRLTEVSARVLGDEGEFTVEDAVVRTNAFERNLNEFGPISIGSIRRSEQNRLVLSDVTLQAGPVGAPFLTMQGQVNNALQFSDFDFTGEITAPARLLFVDLAEDVADQFGELEGTFTANDRAGFPQLTSLKLGAAKTDLWTLKAHSDSGQNGGPLSLDLDIAFEVADTARFLAALGLQEVDVSPLGLNFRADVNTDGFDAEVALSAGLSKITSSWKLDSTNRLNVLTGEIISEEVVLDDIRKWLAGAAELKKSNLFVGDRPQDEDQANDSVPVQPLILHEHEITLAELLAQEGVQPLILPTSDMKLKDLFDPDAVLMHTKVDIQIGVERITGVKGVTSLSSELVSENGKARLGPLKLAFDDGFVDFSASMDVVEAPNVVSVRGATGGWDLGRLLEGAGVDIDASGTLNGNFDLTGRHESFGGFLDSMTGPVSVRMADGHIATSLLELAGLGVLPWLISKERREKTTRIVCLSAPLSIRQGRVAFDRAVLETAKVQAVAKGAANWRDDTISVRAEARPVGKPLSRSAWPVDVTGRLSAPSIKPQIGGSRSRRADGATKMPAMRKPCVPDILQLVAE